ncbi:hypothetical protein NUF46_003935 [Yersinia enterocolitica]|nr:hypothetical protein [Yersinia enterocolitica]
MIGFGDVVAGAPRCSLSLVLPPLKAGLLSSGFSRRQGYSLTPAMPAHSPHPKANFSLVYRKRR